MKDQPSPISAFCCVIDSPNSIQPQPRRRGRQPLMKAVQATSRPTFLLFLVALSTMIDHSSALKYLPSHDHYTVLDTALQPLQMKLRLHKAIHPLPAHIYHICTTSQRTYYISYHSQANEPILPLTIAHVLQSSTLAAPSQHNHTQLSIPSSLSSLRNLFSNAFLILSPFLLETNGRILSQTLSCLHDDIFRLGIG